MITYKNKNFSCLLDLSIDFIRGKWRAPILYHLSNSPKRFLELARLVDGISHKVLNQNLKELEEEGLIEKKDYNENPPRVEYSLTSKGFDLAKSLTEIYNWSVKYYSHLEEEKTLE